MISGAYWGGLSHLLTLLSFVLLLCSLYGITNFFDWRLLNAIMIFIITALILCFNSIYFMPMFEPIKNRLTNNGFFTAFGRVVNEPLLFTINCIFALLFIITGIVNFAVRKHAKKAR